MTPRELADEVERLVKDRSRYWFRSAASSYENQLCNLAPVIARALREQDGEINRLRTETGSLKAQAIVRMRQISFLRAEIAQLKTEMSVHHTPDGGVVGMLTITPEAAKGLMEEDDGSPCSHSAICACEVCVQNHPERNAKLIEGDE